MSTIGPAINVIVLRSVADEIMFPSRTAALAGAAAFAERYPTATSIDIRIAERRWRDEVTSGISYVARLRVEWEHEEYTEPGPAPRPLADLQIELERIAEERA